MITLYPDVIVKCQSLIRLGAFLCIFSVYEFKRVSDVMDSLYKNRLSLSDATDLKLLCGIMLQIPELSDELKQDIGDVAYYLDLKIFEFGEIKKSCGFHFRNT